MIGQAAHDSGHVKLGFANARNAARADHAAGAGIVGGERLLERLVRRADVARRLADALKALAEQAAGRHRLAARRAASGRAAACEPVDTAAFVAAQLVSPSSHGGNHWLWAALHTPEEPPSHLARSQRLWCRLMTRLNQLTSLESFSIPYQKLRWRLWCGDGQSWRGQIFCQT